MFESIRQDYFIEAGKVNEDESDFLVKEFWAKFEASAGNEYLKDHKIESIERQFFTEVVKEKHKIESLWKRDYKALLKGVLY